MGGCLSIKRLFVVHFNHKEKPQSIEWMDYQASTRKYVLHTTPQIHNIILGCPIFLKKAASIQQQQWQTHNVCFVVGVTYKKGTNFMAWKKQVYEIRLLYFKGFIAISSATRMLPDLTFHCKHTPANIRSAIGNTLNLLRSTPNF